MQREKSTITGKIIETNFRFQVKKYTIVQNSMKF